MPLNLSQSKIKPAIYFSWPRFLLFLSVGYFAESLGIYGVAGKSYYEIASLVALLFYFQYRRSSILIFLFTSSFLFYQYSHRVFYPEASITQLALSGFIKSFGNTIFVLCTEYVLRIFLLAQKKLFILETTKSSVSFVIYFLFIAAPIWGFFDTISLSIYSEFQQFEFAKSMIEELLANASSSLIILTLFAAFNGRKSDKPCNKKELLLYAFSLPLVLVFSNWPWTPYQFHFPALAIIAFLIWPIYRMPNLVTAISIAIIAIFAGLIHNNEIFIFSESRWENALELNFYLISLIIFSLLMKTSLQERNKTLDKLIQLNTQLEQRVKKRTIQLENTLKDIKVSHAVFNSTHEGIMVTNMENQITVVNPAFSKITGYSEDDIKGKNPSVLSSGRHDTQFYEIMWREIDTRGSWEGEIWNKTKEGRIFPEWMIISKLKDDSNNPIGYVGVFSDISVLKQQEKKLWFNANYDPLTKLANRNLFMERLHSTIEHAKANKNKVLVLTFDLDNFKPVNDIYGHSAGDIVLKVIAKRLKHLVRSKDTVSRFGGDEFNLLIEISEDGFVSKALLERIITVGNKVIHIQGKQTVQVGISIGISIYPNDSKDPQELLKFSDQALYQSKSQGKNRYTFFKPELNVEVMRKAELENDLKYAIDRNELELYFQPIVNFNTAEVAWVEALLRWKKGDKLISPTEFIPIAENSKLILQLQEFVIESVFKISAKWANTEFSNIGITLNLSNKYFEDSAVDTFIFKCMQQSKIRAETVGFEITESVMMNEPDIVENMLLNIKSRGFKILMDDFGSGYSSLSYLSKFPVDIIKIDQSFLHRYSQNGKARHLLSAIIFMAKSLNMPIIAEGIEDELQIHFVKPLGCTMGQGYIFSKPLPLQEVENFLKKPIEALKS